MDLDAASWSYWTWCLTILGALHLGAFLHFFFSFERAERHAQTGDAESIARFNNRLRGFPNAFYAKMFGKKPLETTTSRDGSS